MLVFEEGRFWSPARAAQQARRRRAMAGVRTMLARLPAWLRNRTVSYLLAFDDRGQITRTLQAVSRDDLPSFSSVVESAGALYMGTPGIGARIDADAIYRSRLATPQ
jgi:hypothetical protein